MSTSAISYAVTAIVTTEGAPDDYGRQRHHLEWTDADGIVHAQVRFGVVAECAGRFRAAGAEVVVRAYVAERDQPRWKAQREAAAEREQASRRAAREAAMAAGGSR